MSGMNTRSCPCIDGFYDDGFSQACYGNFYNLMKFAIILVSLVRPTAFYVRPVKFYIIEI